MLKTVGGAGPGWLSWVLAAAACRKDAAERRVSLFCEDGPTNGRPALPSPLQTPTRADQGRQPQAGQAGQGAGHQHGPRVRLCDGPPQARGAQAVGCGLQHSLSLFDGSSGLKLLVGAGWKAHRRSSTPMLPPACSESGTDGVAFRFVPDPHQVEAALEVRARGARTLLGHAVAAVLAGCCAAVPRLTCAVPCSTVVCPAAVPARGRARHRLPGRAAVPGGGADHQGRQEPVHAALLQARRWAGCSLRSECDARSAGRRSRHGYHPRSLLPPSPSPFLPPTAARRTWTPPWAPHTAARRARPRRRRAPRRSARAASWPRRRARQRRQRWEHAGGVLQRCGRCWACLGNVSWGPAGRCSSAAHRLCPPAAITSPLPRRASASARRRSARRTRRRRGCKSTSSGWRPRRRRRRPRRCEPGGCGARLSVAAARRGGRFSAAPSTPPLQPLPALNAPLSDPCRSCPAWTWALWRRSLAGWKLMRRASGQTSCSCRPAPWPPPSSNRAAADGLSTAGRRALAA